MEAAQGALDDDRGEAALLHLADARGLACERSAPERLEGSVGGFRADGDDHRSFVGDVQRIEPEQLASSDNIRRNRHISLDDGERMAAGRGPLVQDGRHAATGGVAHGPHRDAGAAQGLDQRRQRRAIAHRFRLNRKAFASVHHGDAVAANGTGHKDGVAGPEACRPHRRRRDANSDAGGGDEELVDGTTGDDFGVAGDDGDPCPRGCFGGAAQDPLE